MPVHGGMLMKATWMGKKEGDRHVKIKATVITLLPARACIPFGCTQIYCQCVCPLDFHCMYMKWIFVCYMCPLDFLCMCVFCIVLCCWYVLCYVRVFMLCLFVTLCVYVYACIPVNMYMYVSLFMRHINNITNTQNDKLNKAKLKRKQSLFRRKFPIPPVLSHQSDHEQEQLWRANDWVV